MRNELAAGIGFTLALAASPVAAQGLPSVEAINLCERFVEESIRPEMGERFKQPYKIVCYFGLVDPEIETDHRSVCSRISRQLADIHRQIAELMCVGAYQSRSAASN